MKLPQRESGACGGHRIGRYLGRRGRRRGATEGDRDLAGKPEARTWIEIRAGSVQKQRHVILVFDLIWQPWLQLGSENQVNKKATGIGGEECENCYWLNLDLGMAGSAR